MRLVTVAPVIPDPSTGGGGNWGSCLLRTFASQGHDVTHIAVLGKHGTTARLDELRALYEKLGIKLEIIPFTEGAPAPNNILQKLRVLADPRPEDLWPREMKIRPAVVSRIDKISPDCVFLFAFDAVLYTDGLASAPRVSFLAEGPHLNTFVNWRYDPQVEPGPTPAYLRYTVQQWAAMNAQERAYVNVLRKLTVAGFGGPHYARWAKSKGLTNGAFLTTPTPDPVGARWKELRGARPANEKCRVLMIGHLHSTSNRSQLPILFNETLPAMIKEWGEENFELRIVGSNDRMPARFDRWRSHPAVRFLGPTSEPSEEFLSCDVLLVPVPAKTGSRVRILNGWSYGCCVVAHDANALGIPELVDGQNALLASDGAGLARRVRQAAGDPALRARLGENGRQTFESFYTEDVAGRQFIAQAQKAIDIHKARR